jgi:PKD repeat protein
MRFYYADSLTLERNIVNGVRNTAGYGLFGYYTSNLEMHQNQIYVPTYAVYLYNSNFGSSTSTSEVSNNFLSSSASYGLYLNIPNRVTAQHNSVRGGSYGCYITGTSSDVDVRNNIFVSNNNNAIRINTTPSNFTLDYNIYHTGGATLAYQGSNYATLAAWQTAQSSLNVNSLQGDPGFLSLADFHIVGTLPNDVGLNGLATVDVDGDSRPASGSTTVDIGADEFTPLNWDVKPLAITEPSNASCGDSLTVVKIAFQNLGLMSATNVSATVNVTGSATATLTGSFTGSLASLATDTISVTPFNTAAGGTYTFEAIVTTTTDQDATNDTLYTTLMINDVLARTPTASADTVCAGQYDTLFFPGNSGNLSFQWMTTAGDTIGSTDSLVVGPMSANDTTFILNPVSSSSYVGPVDNTIGAGANYTAMNHFLLFTVTSTTSIISVDVFANGAGNVDVLIQDGTTNATLFTHTVAITAGGLQTLVLNQPLPPGTYRMGGTTVNNAGGLFRNSAGASYPYTSTDGSVSITGNTFSPTYHYFFYNWKIGTGGCPRPDGAITIYNGGVMNAAFTSSLNPPTMVDLTVDFDASSSVNATSYDWDFGDGTTGTGVTTSHTYAANGTYNVLLTITGACGVDTITEVVTIAGIGLEETLLGQTLNVFPNPNNGKFRVEFQVEGLKNVELRVSTLLGQEIYANKPGNVSGDYREEIDLSNQATGVYVLQIITDDHVVSRRVTIRK